jgi:hypothetical protein
MPDADDDRPITQRTVLIWVQTVVLGVVMVVLAAVWLYLFIEKLDVVRGEFKTHFAGVVGLPALGMGALVLVLTLRHTEGPIKFEGLGFKFEGAAAPLVFWIMAFLAMCLGAKLLWELQT